MSDKFPDVKNSTDKCKVLKNKLDEIDELKHTYCYNKESLEKDYCISLNYKKWLFDLEYQKYCSNNISKVNKNVKCSV